MLVLLFVSRAIAGAAGDPVPDPDLGIVRLAVRGEANMAEVVDVDCPRDGRCEAVWRSNGGVLEAQLALVQGVGIYGGIGYANTRVKEADYRGDGLDYGGGLRVAVPVHPSGWWLAANGRYQGGSGQGVELEAGGHETAWYSYGTLTLLTAWRETSGGVSAWFGGEGAVLWEHHVEPLGSDEDGSRLDIGLKPTHPLSGVVGASLTSDPMGAAWTRSVRISLGFEGRGGQVWGASGWLALAY